MFTVGSAGLSIVYLIEPTSSPVLIESMYGVSYGLYDGIDFIDKNHPQNIKIDMHIGKNRIVRRIFEYFQYKVLALDRVEYAIFKKEKF